MSTSEDRAKAIAKDWEHHSYYEDAEQWIPIFWNKGTPFRTLFDMLDVRVTAELACGHGRHAAQMVDRAEKLYLADINQSNLDACSRRFEKYQSVEYILTEGDSLAAIPSSSLTALFSYDAMVHFEADTVIRYLEEIARVLVPGGRALLHYSNLYSMPAVEYGHGPHMRNYFGETLMTHFAHRRGLRRIESRTIDWGDAPIYYGLDGLTLLEKV